MLAKSFSTIDLCMIVKDESHVIERCMQSALPLVDSFTIVDTGSTDTTKEIILQFFEKNKIKGRLIEEEWSDFAVNRTSALSYSRESGADYALMLDADEYLKFNNNFNVLDFKKSLSFDYYNIPNKQNGTLYYKARLTANRHKFIYKGVMHEFLDTTGYKNKHIDPDSQFYCTTKQDGARSQLGDKFLKDAYILEDALKSETDSRLVARYTFYAAQTFKNAGQIKKALNYYIQRTKLGFWHEECYQSCLKAADLMIRLNYSADKVINIYLQAIEFSPNRAEVYYYLSKYCQKNKRPKLAYQLLKEGVDKTISNDFLFVEKWIYDYAILDDYSIACYKYGQYQQAYGACTKLLEDRKIPTKHVKRVEKNKSLAYSRLHPTGFDKGNANLIENIEYLSKNDKFSEAKSIFNSAIENLNSQELSKIGLIFARYNNFKHAEIALLKSSALDKNNHFIYFNLGKLYSDNNELSKAERCYLKAISLDNKHVSAIMNLALLLCQIGRFKESKSYFEKVLLIDKKHISAKWNLSLVLLTLEEFNKGWRDFDLRYHPLKKSTNCIKPKIDLPFWKGEDLSNKHLFIWAEQGVGDEVMFASVITELHNLGCRITVSCDPRLVELFARSFSFIRTIPKDNKHLYQQDKDSFDYQIAIGSLSKLYRPNIESFSNYMPYLKPDPLLLKKWKKRYQKLPKGLNIGISWKGGKKTSDKRLRSIALSDFANLFSRGVNIINLQYGDCKQEVDEFFQETGRSIYDWEDADPLKDLENFAAQISALDLVISIDNSTVHLAGALGIKTQALIPEGSDWRWGNNRSQSYWYGNFVRLVKIQSESIDCSIQEINRRINKK